MREKLIKILFILLFISPCVLHSQQVQVEQYPFINYQDNTLQFYSNSKPLFSPLFEKIAQLLAFDNKQLRVLHIGEKQIKDEILPQTIYDNFTKTMPGLSCKRGSFWEDLYCIKPFDEKEITLTPNEPQGSLNCNSFRVYHSTLSDKMDLIIEDLKFYSQSTYFKDKGYTLFETKEKLKNLKLKAVNNSFDNLFIYGFYLQDKDVEFMYDLISRNNSLVTQYALDDALMEQIKNTDVDMVVLSLGENDISSTSYESEEFIDDMNKIIHNIRKVKPNIPIILTTPMDSYSKGRVNSRLEQLTDDIIEAGKKSDCAVWDFYKIMGQKGSSAKWAKEGLMDRKKNSMLPKGYVLEGNLYFNAFWNAFEQYLSERKR